MLARDNRLTKRADFTAVREKGALTASESFSLSVYNRKDDKPSRFGFVIPNKIIPLSSHRTKIKRAISEGLRQNMYAVKNGYDCVVLPKPAADKKYTSDLMREVRDALKKAKLIK